MKKQKSKEKVKKKGTEENGGRLMTKETEPPLLAGGGRGRTSESGGNIVAANSEPVDDEYAVNCTLFKVTDLSLQVEGSQVVAFTHVQTGLRLAYRGSGYIKRLIIWRYANKYDSQFKVVRYDEIPKLPKRVTFKGDNGRYLSCRWQRPDIDAGDLATSLVVMLAAQMTFDPNMNSSNWYNEFKSKDGANRSTHYEITHYNGTINIKSLASGKFLRRANYGGRHDNWIWGDSEDINIIEKRDTLFKVESLGNNAIALRNIVNNKVCRRLSNDGLFNCLKATETYAVPEAHLVVEEPVTNRKVEAKYKLSDAKITSLKLIHHSTITGVNKYTSRDDELSDSFTYNKTRKTSWSTNTTITNSFNAEIKIPIPKYVDGNIQLSSQTVENRHLEKESISSEQRKVQFKIKIPPKTKAILRGYVHEVSYDIPYSYIQTDVYTTGEKITIVDAVGVCQGVEAYDFHYEKEYIPL